MIASLLLPTVLTAVAIFFASFLSWMIFQLHLKDWRKLEKEDEFLDAVKNLGIQPGSYSFPGYDDPKELKTEELKQKMEAGPNGIVTVFGPMTMGKNLAMTFVYFLVISFCLGYVATLALEPGAAFADVFRVVGTVGLLVFLGAMIQHAIWFQNRITGHVIESVAYAVIAGAIFGAMWPAA